MQEANQKLTESMADSREEVRDLTLAMKNLEMQNIQLKKWMEDMTKKMARGMLTESVADSRKEVRDLKLAMKNLELQNIQQKKWMEDMARKMAREMKSLENNMAQVKATRACEETQGHPLQKSIYSFASQPYIPEGYVPLSRKGPRAIEESDTSVGRIASHSMKQPLDF